MFKKLSNSRPFLKMAFEGFAGDGKTFTATQVAIGLHRLIGSKKPIAFFDTEKASKALVGILRDAGIEAIVSDEHRSLAALSQAIKACEDGAADILIIDSITHVWEEYLGAYMREKRRTRLEFQDWGVIKPKWKAEFSTPFVNAKCHIIFTGRAGYSYDQEKDDEGRKSIVKSGIKMKAETETAFEPDLLVLMEKVMDTLSEKKSVYRLATVLKDRTDKIDGKTFKNPSFDDFAPAVRVLLDGIVSTSTVAAIQDKFEDAEQKGQEWKRKREKLIAEIDGTFKLIGWGTGAKDQQLKAATLRSVFGVMSMEKLDDKKNEELADGLNVLQQFASDLADELQRRGGQPLEPAEIKAILESARALPI
jgi:hypothetical protein